MVDFSRFYTGDMAPPTKVGGKLTATPTDTNWNEFYGSMGITGEEPAGSGLTSRSVRTVAIDPFTGEPIAAGGNNPAPATVAAAMARGNIQPTWADPSVLRFPQSAVSDRLPQGTAGLPLNTSGGQYGAGNPLVMAALTAQQSVNPAVAAATAMAQGGIKPSWANPAAAGPKFPVTGTPEVRAAYADMVAGVPGAQKRYAMLLADAAPTMGQGPVAMPPAVPVKVGPSGVGTNGYTYVNGQNMGYAPEEQAKRLVLGRAIAEANRQNPNPTYTVSGDRNDFQPRSVQESVRWQTGY